MAPTTHFRGSLWITFGGVHPNAFDGNPLAIENPFVHFAETPRGEGEAADAMERTSEFVRCREYRPNATYVYEFAQTRSESRTAGIENIESLKNDLSGERGRAAWRHTLSM